MEYATLFFSLSETFRALNSGQALLNLNGKMENMMNEHKSLNYDINLIEYFEQNV